LPEESPPPRDGLKLTIGKAPWVIGGPMAQTGLKRMTLIAEMRKFPVTRPIRWPSGVGQARSSRTRRSLRAALEPRCRNVVELPGPRHVLVTGPVEEGPSKLKCDHSRR
jgi:hypothetical protein